MTCGKARRAMTLPPNRLREAFGGIHAEAGKWLALQDLLAGARRELPRAATEDPRRSAATVRGWAGRNQQEFLRVLPAVFEALGDRLLGGSWPNNLEVEEEEWISRILADATGVIAEIAPTPENPLKPTIIPFPNAAVEVAALWFCTEWWMERGSE